MNSYQIERNMKAMLNDFEEAVVNEWITFGARLLIEIATAQNININEYQEVRDAMPLVREQMQESLIGEVNNCNSRASGGFSIGNALEQTRRDLAMKILSRSFGNPLSAAAIQTVAMKLVAEKEAEEKAKMIQYVEDQVMPE